MSTLRYALAGAVLAICAGCGGDEPPTAAEVQAAFTGSCAFSTCHAGASPAGEMSLEAGNAFMNIIDVPSMQLPSKVRVAPGDVDGSYLMDKILGMGVEGDQMPPTAPLSEARTDLIRRWIEAGAPTE